MAANFMVEVMEQAEMEQIFHQELAAEELAKMDLGKFDPDDFDMHEDAFLNLLKQSYGILKEPLSYVVCPEEVPAVFATNQEECMFQLPLAGDTFEMDNAAVCRKLKEFLLDSPGWKEFLLDSPGWAWIEPHDTSKNGCTAFKAWTDHYNGRGELSKCTAIAKKAKLDTVNYRNEHSMSFERCTEIMMQCCF